MKCPECNNEMIRQEEDDYSEEIWNICECGQQIGLKQADNDVLDSYFPDRNKEERENIERIVKNFILFFISNDKERKEMEAMINDFVEEELE